MIDRQSRNTIAEAARQYLAGLSTNFEFDDILFELHSEDPAIEAMCQQLWLVYDDLRKHKNEGKWKLNEAQREIVVRIVMFLKSDLEYSWPAIPEWYKTLRPVIYLLSLGVAVKALDRKFEYIDELDVWPFRNESEIEVTKHAPKYLASAT